MLDVEELRRAAAAARAADDELARAASEASERPPSGEVRLGTAESAFAQVLEIQEDLPAAWRRLVGALISATGMAIVVGALGWNVYWLLVPIALIAILTVDLRLSGRAAREASAGAAQDLASVGAEGTESLERIRLQRTQVDEAEGRLAAARADRDAAYDRFEDLAPGRRPSEVEEIIDEWETEQAALAEAAQAETEAAAEAETEAAAEAEAEAAAEAQAEAAAQPETEPETPAEPEDVEAPAAEITIGLAEPEDDEAPAAEITIGPAEPEDDEAPAAEITIGPAEPEDDEAAPESAAAAVTTPEPAVKGPATASEWWFGSKEAPAPPPAAPAPVRALAERLSAEGREALARIEAQLATLERVELAKKSIEWHEANGSAEPATDAPPKGSDRT